MRNITIVFLLGLLSQSAIASAPVIAPIESSEYQRCEAEGFVAYGTARETLRKRLPKNHWTLHPYRSDYQLSIVDELYARIESGNLKNHLIFGAEKFHSCMDEVNFPLAHTPEKTATCFAKADVALYAQDYKAGGGGIAGTKKYARNYLKNTDDYPKKMLDEIIPIAFKATSLDEFLAIRNQIFRDCVYSNK